MYISAQIRETIHWHSDREVALYSNSYFINSKVDPEERPNLDALYLQVVASMAGHAGWPLNVWLTGEMPTSYEQWPSALLVAETGLSIVTSPETREGCRRKSFSSLYGKDTARTS